MNYSWNCYLSLMILLMMTSPFSNQTHPGCNCSFLWLESWICLHSAESLDGLTGDWGSIFLITLDAEQQNRFIDQYFDLCAWDWLNFILMQGATDVNNGYPLGSTKTFDRHVQVHIQEVWKKIVALVRKPIKKWKSNRRKAK